MDAGFAVDFSYQPPSKFTGGIEQVAADEKLAAQISKP